MDQIIFKKMHVKAGYTAFVIAAPENFPQNEDLIYDNSDTQVDYVHLFVLSVEDFKNNIHQALNKRKPKGLLWISYPKSTRQLKYNINRDILWDLSIQYGIHPVSQISLNDTWSAVRFDTNLPGVIYERPKSK